MDAWAKFEAFWQALWEYLYKVLAHFYPEDAE